MGRPLKPKRRVFVDRRIQLGLCLRVVLYWLCCLITTMALLSGWLSLGKSPRSLQSWIVLACEEHALALAITLIVMPLVLVDLVMISNRYARPLQQIRQALKQLGDGQDVRPIAFREGDFYPEIAIEFNRVARRLEILSHDPFPDQLTPTIRDGTATGAGSAIAPLGDETTSR